jgi:hypothetical protein
LAAQARGVQILMRCVWIASQEADLITQPSGLFEIKGRDRRFHAMAQMFELAVHPQQTWQEPLRTKR